MGREPPGVCPATSVQLPFTNTPWPSGPTNTAELQDAIPDTESAPRKARPTGWLNQPLWSGGRSGCIPFTDGAVLSIPNQTGFETVAPSAHRTLHERSYLPSAKNVPFWQPVVLIALGPQDHIRDTEDAVYQCSHPSRTVGVSQK